MLLYEPEGSRRPFSLQSPQGTANRQLFLGDMCLATLHKPYGQAGWRRPRVVVAAPSASPRAQAGANIKFFSAISRMCDSSVVTTITLGIKLSPGRLVLKVESTIFQ